MKKYFLFIAIILMVSGSSLWGADNSEDPREDIIRRYMEATGQIKFDSHTAASDDDQLPLKCGTSHILDFILNYDKFDKTELMAAGVKVNERPLGLDLYLDSPLGFFRIHYTNTGTNAVRSDIPNYVDSVANIFDYVYTYLVDTLGYPAPPSDGFYDTRGGDGKFDVYLINLSSSYYGLTYPDSLNYEPTNMLATAYMELDNDYLSLPNYSSRPLDAVRVTAAHEFFHVVQFGIDVYEADTVTINNEIWRKNYWKEMSATQMEEEIYDDVNDYYYYLPAFFEDPGTSIQEYNFFTSNLHTYASMLYPLYLSEKFGPEINREIWLRCGTYGLGPSFLVAANNMIDSISNGTESFATTFSEFALWNYFTGSRAGLSPNNIGYSERFNFNEEFSDDPVTGRIMIKNTYPLRIDGNNNPFKPEHNSAFYLKLDEIAGIRVNPDTTYWNCITTLPCTDSTKVSDPLDGYDMMHIDSFLTILVTFEYQFPYNWGMSVVYDLLDEVDSLEIERFLLPPGTQSGSGINIQIPNHELYNSVMFIFTPASGNKDLYVPRTDFFVFLDIKDTTTLNIFCPGETKRFYINEGSYFCDTLIILPDTAVVTTSYGTYDAESNLLCFDVYTIGIFIDTVIAEYKTSVDTCILTYEILPTAFSATTPYPNPVVINELDLPEMYFRINIEGESGIPVIGMTPYIQVDIYNVAGEYIRTLSTEVASPTGGETTLTWDLKNSSGKDVASGVYISQTKFYTAKENGELLDENEAKILIVR